MKLCPNEMVWCLTEAKFTGVWTVDGVSYPHVVIGAAIGMAESKGDCEAMGFVTTGTPPSGNFDLGWGQVSTRWHGPKLQALPDWRNPFVNAVLMKQAFDETAAINLRKGNGLPGWSAWATFNGGQFKPWLPFAARGALHPFPPVLPNYRPEIQVAAPDVIVNPTPVTVDPREIPLVVTVSYQPAAVPHGSAGGVVFASSSDAP